MIGGFTIHISTTKMKVNPFSVLVRSPMEKKPDSGIPATAVVGTLPK